MSHCCRMCDYWDKEDKKEKTMINEFDLGFKECEENKVAFLYARIEDAISDLQNAKVSKADIISDLRRALRASDDNKEDKFLVVSDRQVDRACEADAFPNK